MKKEQLLTGLDKTVNVQVFGVCRLSDNVHTVKPRENDERKKKVGLDTHLLHYARWRPVGFLAFQINCVPASLTVEGRQRP